MVAGPHCIIMPLRGPTCKISRFQAGLKFPSWTECGKNDKLNIELAKMQNTTEISESESKAKEKVNKIKENTKLFNRIIKDKIESGEYKDIDISKYVDDDDMEECDGGDASIETTGYGGLSRLAINKKLGGKRSNPQEEPFVVKQSSVRKQAKLHKCPQCDFATQNENILMNILAKYMQTCQLAHFV